MEDDKYMFPDPETSDKQGLLLIGGNLSPKRLIQAYSQGIFPWFEPGCPILWWSPNPRLILYPEDFKCSRSLQKTLKKPYTFTIDTAFKDVIEACARENGRLNNTWITNEMIDAYTALHELGYAHSFEVWRDEQLLGGLYGISLGQAFFGESMFHLEKDASKLALYFLCKTMKDWNFDFIDCQLPTRHLESLGAKVISRKEFLHLLRQSLRHPNIPKKWIYKTE